MGLIPSSLDLGRFDSPFDNGTGCLALPIEYHQLFQLSCSFLPQIVASRTPGLDGNVYVVLNPFVLTIFDRLVQDLLRHIALALYGAAPPNINALSSLRPGSLEELSLTSPPLLKYYQLYNSTSGPQSRALRMPMREQAFKDWLQVFHDAIRNTRTWLMVAQFRARFFRNLARWDWAPFGTNLNGESAAPPYNPHDPHLPLAPSSLGPSQGFIAHYTAESMTSGPSLALIPHPVLGPGAHNSLIPYHLFPLPQTTNTVPVVLNNGSEPFSATLGPEAAYSDPCYFVVPLLPQDNNESEVKEEELDDKYELVDRDDVRSNVGTYNSTDSEMSDNDDMYYTAPEETKGTGM